MQRQIKKAGKTACAFFQAFFQSGRRDAADERTGGLSDFQEGGSRKPNLSSASSLPILRFPASTSALLIRGPPENRGPAAAIFLLFHFLRLFILRFLDLLVVLLSHLLLALLFVFFAAFVSHFQLLLWCQFFLRQDSRACSKSACKDLWNTTA
jgi:hypothetical protein